MKQIKLLIGLCLVFIISVLFTGCSSEIPTSYDLNTTLNNKDCKQYSLTVINDSDYGMIYPNLENDTNSVMVNEGSAYTFTIRAKTGYELKNLLIDGTLLPPQETYTFSEINADHSIGAIYTKTESKISEDHNNISKLKLIGVEMSLWAEEGSEYIGKTLNYYGGFTLYQDKRIENKDYLFDDDFTKIWGSEDWSITVTNEEEKTFKQVAVTAEKDIIVPNSGVVVLRKTANQGIQYLIDTHCLNSLNNEYYENAYEYCFAFKLGGESTGWYWEELKLVFEVEFSN